MLNFSESSADCFISSSRMLFSNSVESNLLWIVSAIDLLIDPVNKNKSRIKICVFRFNIFVSLMLQ